MTGGGPASCSTAIDRLEHRFAEVEPRVLAFCRSRGASTRLRREARALAARYPDRAARPPLFGAPGSE